MFAGGIAIEEVGSKIWIWQLLACALQVAFVYFMCPEVCFLLRLMLFESVAVTGVTRLRTSRWRISTTCLRSRR